MLANARLYIVLNATSKSNSTRAVCLTAMPVVVVAEESRLHSEPLRAPHLSSLLSYNLDMRDADHLLRTGSINGYQWLVSTDREIDVLACCPDVVLRKYVAITSFDSGPLALTEAQRSASWVSCGGIAYSPEIQHANMVPQAYFSELYVFGAPTNLGVLADPNKNIFESEMQQGQVHAFVNFDFGFHDPEYADLAQMFWRQLGWMKAESYLAENDYVIFATANQELFKRVFEALRQVR